MAENDELFKTTLMGGYDKEDVLRKFQEQKDRSYAAEKKLEAELEEKNRKIQELSGKVQEQEEKIQRLQTDIREKYQGYIENYESIGKLVYDSKVKAKMIQKESEAVCQKRMQDTEAACEKMVEDARKKGEEMAAVYEQQLRAQAEQIQGHMEAELAIAREKYQAVYLEIDRLTEILDGTQKGFMEAFRQVHMLKREMAESAENMEEFLANPVQKMEENPVKREVRVKEDETREPEEEKASPVVILENQPEYLDEGGNFDDQLDEEIHCLLHEEEE